MTEIFKIESEEEHALRIGAKRKYRWRKQRKHIPGPPQRRSVVLIVVTPRYDERRSATIPNSYSVHWYLECGHRIIPARLPSDTSFRDWYRNPAGYYDPETYQTWCATCQRSLDTFEETRVKEYYFDYHAGHALKRCKGCSGCMLCDRHSKKCLEPLRYYLMDCIFEVGNYWDDDGNPIDQLKDNVSAVVDVLTRRQLNQALGAYAED